MDKDYIITITGVFVTLIALIIGVTTYNIHEADLVAEAVKGGADPVAAYCGINGPASYACVILAAKTTQSK